ncbi:AI-2E family transporter [Falsiporphyromonas endometrii]|uniref:AI-2E family transporter n=1 Tax=Falsiporphyromonas endometrii TaxID=1387297 RepID=A0ABV9K8V5_9PORP
MKGFFNREFTFDRTFRSIFVTIIVVAIFGIIFGLRSVLIPFALAWIFAYIVLPFVRFVQYKLHIHFRVLSVVIVFFVILGIATILALTLIPQIQEEVSKTWSLIQEYTKDNTFLQHLPEPIRNVLTRNASLDDFIKGISADTIMTNSKELLTKMGDLISGTISVVSSATIFAMGIVYFIFILIDYEKLVQGMIKLFPMGMRRKATMMMADLDYYMNNYFRGQALVALSVGILLAIGFKIIGLPLSITIGLFIGALNFVPYMQVLGIPPLIFLAGLQSIQDGGSFIVSVSLAIGVLAIVQVIQDTILVPNIMGKQMGMRPSLILLCITIWGTLLGFFGLIVALPLTMALYSFYMTSIINDPQYINAHNEERDYRRMKRRQKYLKQQRNAPTK